MSVAELLLRLGAALVGWMMVYTHVIWLATLRIIGCNSGTDELWRLLFGLAPFIAGFTALLITTRSLVEVHRILRWFALPLIPLTTLALIPVFDTLKSATLGDAAICGVVPIPWWHIWWAPVQLLVLGWIAWTSIRVWRVS